MKKMKSLLNKLTPNNFAKLKEQALSFPIDTEDRLKGIIDLVFEKVLECRWVELPTQTQCESERGWCPK